MHSKLLSLYEKILKFSLCFCLALSLGACGEENDNKHKQKTEPPKNESHTEASHTIIVGTSADYMPFTFVKDGKVVGFDIDLMNAIAKNLGSQVVIKDMQFYSLIPSLQNGDIHVIAAGMFRTPEREKEVDFSIPYYSNKFALVVKGSYDANDPLKAGMKIGTQTGTLMYQWLKAKELNIDIVVMDKVLELIEDLKNDRLNGVLLDEISARNIVQANPNSQLSVIALNDVSATGISLAVKKGSNLLSKINSAIKELEDKGTIHQIKAKWDIN